MNEDYLAMLGLLGEEKVEFLLVGAHALAAYQIPRATGDIDIWVRPTDENAARVWRALCRFGAPLERFAESDFAKPDLIAQFGVAPVRIDFMTTLPGVEFHEAWENHTTIVVGGLTIPVIGKEQLIRNKRQAGRRKDLKDVQRLESAKRRKKR